MIVKSSITNPSAYTFFNISEILPGDIFYPIVTNDNIPLLPDTNNIFALADPTDNMQTFSDADSIIVRTLSYSEDFVRRTNILALRAPVPYEYPNSDFRHLMIPPPSFNVPQTIYEYY